MEALVSSSEQARITNSEHSGPVGGRGETLPTGVGMPTLGASLSFQGDVDLVPSQFISPEKPEPRFGFHVNFLII
jgi:hypothetical protein